MDELQQYANLAGNSGVTHFGLLDEGSMMVMFKDGSIYVYPNVINSGHIRTMMVLASNGRGLATYIARFKPIGARVAVVFGLSIR